ncbi:MAG: glycoside hydrolase family 16 protein, partial [Clostridia bacterium]|nr:glycoside hydrolase family 16 protein [Clostridia bacterium]
DIMESMRYGVEHEGSVENNIHYFDETGHQRLHARWVIVGDDAYDEFHTYGLKWDTEGYTFYVDGKECRKTDFGLASGPEYIVLSNFMRDFKTKSIEGDSADFVVDYVRVYQQK